MPKRIHLTLPISLADMENHAVPNKPFVLPFGSEIISVAVGQRKHAGKLLVRYVVDPDNENRFVAGAAGEKFLLSLVPGGVVCDTTGSKLLTQIHLSDRSPSTHYVYLAKGGGDGVTIIPEYQDITFAAVGDVLADAHESNWTENLRINNRYRRISTTTVNVDRSSKLLIDMLEAAGCEHCDRYLNKTVVLLEPYYSATNVFTVAYSYDDLKLTIATFELED